MSRRRAPEVDGDRLLLNRAARARLARAQRHGFREDSSPSDFDPIELYEEQPSRRWCAAMYREHRDVFVAGFVERPYSVVRAWIVASFETDDVEVRDQARAVLADDDERRRGPDPRELLAE